jgi:hypothetical protein
MHMLDTHVWEQCTRVLFAMVMASAGPPASDASHTDTA